MSSSHTLGTSETSASPDASSPPSDLGQTAALREYTQLFYRHSPETPLEPASPLSFGEQHSNETRPDDAYHEHEESHSSAHKNQDDIVPGQEFTITIAMGPRGLPHSLVTHKGTISYGERKEQVLNLDGSQGTVTMTWMISYASAGADADADADTTMHSRPRRQASQKRRMETQAMGRRCEKRPRRLH